MQENKKFKLVTSKKTRYLLPNILTLAGVCLGISSIKFSIDGNFTLAVTLILFAAILDALDGRIARLIKGTSEFGKELDSLTDFVSFGIAPVFILYFWELNNGEEIIIVQIAGLIARRIVCEVEQGQELKQGDRIGMIRFGSRVDIYFKNKKILAKLGQNVVAGESLLASG